ncbi:MAG: right-handed parallel beta-helix repeat-containing protein, partial [Candidatus Eisenbacteria bacterium]|nr:right-handed parallel beta-helix repeat-containing protein [Candidatus Eisenbacteria bacterium]MBU2691983.1 right-handed parallel beta-helix repeat-containing protein [Candidatus Eisenbacteria bacterium]
MTKWLFFIIQVMLIPNLSLAATWYVTADGTGDAPTIQAAADSSAQGDTVLVSQGTYLENIYISETGISLISESGPELTILDGSAESAPVIYYDEVEGGVVDGFTIQNGNEDLDRGIVIVGHDLLVRNNFLIGNYTISAGGGIQWDGSGAIENNTFIENEAESGGGLYICYSEHDAIPSVRANVFIDNHAELEGGALYLRLDEVVVEENLFEGNEAPEGGAIYCFSANVIRRNTFYRNQTYGGAISFRAATRPLVENNIIAGTIDGFAVKCIAVGGYTPEPQITCNAFWNNQAGIWYEYGCNPAWWPGNFEADPLLCDPESGDFHLAENSPCAPGNHPYEYACGLIGA